MSYGLPEQPRRRGGLGRLIFPAILFFGALMFFSSRSAQVGPQDQAGQGGVYSPERSAQDEKYKIQEDLFEQKGQSDEYKIREGLFEPKKQAMPSRQNQGSVNSTGQGNWSMEDVDGGTNAQSPQSNKTQKGDWSIEEVDEGATKEKPRFKFSDQ